MKRNLLCASLLLAGAMTTTLLSSCDDRDGSFRNNNYHDEYYDNYYGEEEDEPKIGEGWEMKTTDKTPVTLMIYGVGGGNLDEEMINLLYRVNTELLDKMQKQCNVVFQYKFSNSANLKKQSTYFAQNTELTNQLGGIVLRYKMDNGISTKGQNYTDSLLQVFQPASIIGDAKYSFASPDTLASFIKFAAKVAPADNYILMLLNHGGGYFMIDDYTYNKTNEKVITRGTLYDDNLNHEEGSYTGTANLTAKALRQAIKKSGVKITAVEFNLCLENSLEELCEIADVVDYSVASSHVSYLWENSASDLVKNVLNYSDIEKALEQYVNDKYNALETLRQNWKLDGMDGKPTQDVALDVCATKLSALEDVADVVGDFAEVLRRAQIKDSAYVADKIINSCYRFDNDYPYFDITDMMNLALVALSDDAFATDEEAKDIQNDMIKVWAKYLIDAQSAIVEHKNNSKSWKAKSEALSTDDDKVDYDPTWSINLFSEGTVTGAINKVLTYFLPDGSYITSQGQQGTWGSTFADTYGTLIFNDWTKTDTGYSWGQWLLDNKTTPTGNPCYGKIVSW